MPIIDDCKGLYSLVSLVVLCVLIWPLFQLLQRDWLIRLRVGAKRIDWHTLPRNRGGRLLRTYERLQQTSMGRKVWDAWVSSWVTMCELSANALNLLVQLMTLAMSTRLVELCRLFRRTHYAQELMQAGKLQSGSTGGMPGSQGTVKPPRTGMDASVVIWAFVVVFFVAIGGK